MTKEHYDALLALADAKPAAEGWTEAPEDRTITLHLTRNGSSLTISKVEAMRQQDELVFARTQKGELFVVALADLFAGGVDVPKARTRQAGFR